MLELLINDRKGGGKLEITPRRALIVYINGTHVVKVLKHFGMVRYVSKKMHYVVLYVDRDRAEQIDDKVSHLRAVRKVVPSPRPEINPQVSELTQLDLDNKAKEDKQP